MYCIHCGAQISENENICHNCGKKVKKQPIKDAVTFIKQFSFVLISRIKSNIINTIIALAVIALAVIIVCVAVFNSEPKPEKLAQQFAVAQYQSGIIETSKYAIVDGKEIIEDSFEAYCDEEDYSKKEGLEKLEEKYQKMFDEAEIDYKVSVKKFDDIFEIRKEYKQRLNLKKYGKYEINTKVVKCEKLKISQLREKVDYFEQRLENEIADTYNDVEDYVEFGKLKEGYTVEVKTEIDGKKDSQKYTNTYIIVKHEGKYKVLAYN